MESILIANSSCPSSILLDSGGHFAFAKIDCTVKKNGYYCTVLVVWVACCQGGPTDELVLKRLDEVFRSIFKLGRWALEKA